jgi:uncharacterized OB-fold protein/putative sterol carrier protein
MLKAKEKVIPYEFIPDVGSEVLTIDGKKYLVSNDAMYTFYKRTKGEFSDFFLGLRDQRKVLGCKCKKCGIVRVPPFLTHCPDCNFAPTETIEIGQVGVMLSTPPITYFANSMFQRIAPYGRGRVTLEGADTALSANVYTTTGILVPGIVKKGTEVKVVFRDERIGEISDIFLVPTSELTKEQIKKKGLLESEINWERPAEPKLPKATEKDIAAFQKGVKEIKAVFADMNKSERARKDIAGWKRKIQVKATGGEFGILIDNGDIKLAEKKLTSPDFVMVSENINTLVDGLAYRGAITDSVIMKRLWISKNTEFMTIFKLDRMARSAARTHKG